MSPRSRAGELLERLVGLGTLLRVDGERLTYVAPPDGRLTDPHPDDLETDPTYGRAIYLRRAAGAARVTIFEGGHEILPDAALAWLEQHVSSGVPGPSSAE